MKVQELTNRILTSVLVIGKEEFSKLLEEHEIQSSRVDLFNKVFPSAYDSPMIEFGWLMFDKVIEAYFTEEGIDWISYYLYENPKKCYYVNDVEIPLVTIDDLWETVKDYRK